MESLRRFTIPVLARLTSVVSFQGIISQGLQPPHGQQTLGAMPAKPCLILSSFRVLLTAAAAFLACAMANTAATSQTE